MRRIQVTDIPAHETVPLRNLTEHLNSEFDTQQYPVAEFSIMEAAYEGANALRVRGSLTIRGVTKPVEVPAEAARAAGGRVRFISAFTINRSDWKIGSEGSWLARQLVDDPIQLQIEIMTE